MKLMRVFCSLFLLVALPACRQQKSPAAGKPSTPPAKVITEEGLSSIVLTPEAEKRLGIATVAVTVEKIPRSRSVAGDLILPLAQGAGSSRSIYSVLPSMSPTELVRVAELQIEADGKVAAAEVELNAAKVGLQRAESLVANKAGAQRAVDDARAQALLAEAALRTAKERRGLLGAPLFDAMKRDLLWVRAPVYVGDLDAIDLTAKANITTFGSATNKLTRPARPVDVPFSPSVASATIDLFYELDNKDGPLRPGQKVSVTLAHKGEIETHVVPTAAILYDVHGGEWVYENTAPQTFVRRRVEVRFISESKAALVRGLKPGAKVVTTGAPEVFGTEFGISK